MTYYGFNLGYLMVFVFCNILILKGGIEHLMVATT